MPPFNFEVVWEIGETEREKRQVIRTYFKNRGGI